MSARGATLLFIALVSGCNGELRFEQPGAGTDDSASACTEDADCALTTLHCDPVLGECVACRRDEDCEDPALPRCDAALQRCVGCGGDLDCAQGETCLPRTRTCATHCEEGVLENICPESAPTCDEVAHICVQCTSDEDCRGITDDGDYCERSSGRCLACTDDRQCPASQPRCDRVQHRCGQCGTSRDCPPGELCDPIGLRCI